MPPRLGLSPWIRTLAVMMVLTKKKALTVRANVNPMMRRVGNRKRIRRIKTQRVLRKTKCPSSLKSPFQLLLFRSETPPREPALPILYRCIVRSCLDKASTVRLRAMFHLEELIGNDQHRELLIQNARKMVGIYLFTALIPLARICLPVRRISEAFRWRIQ